MLLSLFVMSYFKQFFFPKEWFFHHLTLYLFCNQGEEVCLGSRWHSWHRGSTFGGSFCLEFLFVCFLFFAFYSCVQSEFGQEAGEAPLMDASKQEKSVGPLSEKPCYLG